MLDRTDLELYDAPVAVDFVARIRGQVRFQGIDALIAISGPPLATPTDDVGRAIHDAASQLTRPVTVTAVTSMYFHFW